MRFVLRNVVTLAVVAALVVGSSALAQEDSVATGWRTDLVADWTITQTAYSSSWDGGEAGSFSWVANLKGKAEKQLHPKFDFRSLLKISFGQTMNQDAETGDWQKPQKSTDLIDWDNVGLITLDGYVDPFVGFRVESQFMNAKVPEKKRYLTPLKLTESAGIARHFYKKGDDEVFSRLGLAVKQTISKDIVEGSDPIETESNTVTDAGIESVTDVAKALSERVKYTGKLTLYKAFSFSEKDDFVGTEFEDDWKAIDVNWENIIDAQLSKVIAVNFYTQILYDKQISRKTRIKETLGIGFTFKLM